MMHGPKNIKFGNNLFGYKLFKRMVTAQNI